MHCDNDSNVKQWINWKMNDRLSSDFLNDITSRPRQGNPRRKQKRCYSGRLNKEGPTAKKVIKTLIEIGINRS